MTRVISTMIIILVSLVMYNFNCQKRTGLFEFLLLLMSGYSFDQRNTN